MRGASSVVAAVLAASTCGGERDAGGAFSGTPARTSLPALPSAAPGAIGPSGGPPPAATSAGVSPAPPRKVPAPVADPFDPNATPARPGGGLGGGGTPL